MIVISIFLLTFKHDLHNSRTLCLTSNWHACLILSQPKKIYRKNKALLSSIAGLLFGNVGIMLVVA